MCILECVSNRLCRLCGFPPFYGDTLPIIFEKILAAQYDFPADYWDEVSSEGTYLYLVISINRTDMDLLPNLIVTQIYRQISF